MSNRTRILFLCTGNSARSILAEAIANDMFGDELEACSAGSSPKGQPRPLALSTLAAHGLRADQCRSKSWDEFSDQSFDLVVTLCDSAAKETCPTFPGSPAQAHWGLPDPPHSPATDDAEDAFELVFDALCEALDRLIAPPDYDVAAKAEIVARYFRERFPELNRA